MKKLVAFLLITLIIGSLVGCSNSSTESQVSEPQSSNATSEEPSETKNEEVKYATLIPDPEDYFKQGNITVIDKDGGKAYIFQVRNFQDSEYEAYVAKCKDMGFSDISYESETAGGKMFGAYTEDGTYWVEVLLGGNNGILSVTCKESTKK